MRKNNFSLQNKDYILIVSYGNYAKGQGGTDKVILAHQNMLNSSRYSVVCVFPPRRIKQFDFNRHGYWGVTIDGEYQGVYHNEILINKLFDLEQDNYHLAKIVIHHLKNISLESLTYLLNHIDRDVIFYLHDYYSICNALLVDSEGKYCGKGCPSDRKCSHCEYGEKAISHYNDIAAFIDGLKDRISFIAVSEICKSIWESAFIDFKDKINVVYHQKLEGCNDIYPYNKKIRVAYVGYQAEIKGWECWKKVVRQFSDSDYILLYHLGRAGEKLDGVKNVEVDFKRDINGMINALKNNHIDCAFLWSIVPETYSYTYYESFAANAYVLTYANSGNIAFQVKKNNNGTVYSTDKELLEFLADEERLRKTLTEYKKTGIRGPKELIENDELIFILSQDSFVNRCVLNVKKTGFQIISRLVAGTFIDWTIRLKEK